jgi:hypothetical protein
MLKWIKTLTYAGALMTCASLQGWSNYNVSSNSDQDKPANVGFPLADDQSWFVTQSYLIMQPYLEDTDYATHLKSEGSFATGFDVKVKLEKPDFDWYSGVRLGFGMYLPNYDAWDISTYATYFYADETDESSTDIDDGSFLTSTWMPTLGVPAQESSVAWRLNYFTWDLSLGREYSLMDTISAHPFMGLRAGLIYQKYNNKMSNTFSGDISALQQFKAHNTYWGIGPRAGADFRFKFKNNWAFLGGISGTVLYGSYDVKEKINSFKKTGVPADTDIKAKDSRYCVRTNIEGFVGLGWEAWFRNDSMRLAPSVLFEGTKWYGANKFFEPISSSKAVRHRGHLSLLGFSFNLQLDF